MARGAGTRNITGWQEHVILRELALNEKSPEAIAEEHGLAVQTVYDRRWKKRAQINAILADWSNEFSDLWAVKKHARIAELQADHDAIRARMREMEEDAEHATEVMRRVDPDAAPVRISPLSDYRMLVREKAKLLDQIEKSMGQQASDVRSMSMSWVGFAPPSDVRAHAQYLKMNPEEQVVYRNLIPHFQAQFLKLTEAQRERFLEELEWNDTPREAYDYMRDCLETQTERWERQQREKAWAAAFEEYKAKHPDLDDVAKDVPTEAAPELVTAPVTEPETKKDEAVDLIRMGPSVQEPEPEPEPEPIVGSLPVPGVYSHGKGPP